MGLATSWMTCALPCGSHTSSFTSIQSCNLTTLWQDLSCLGKLQQNYSQWIHFLKKHIFLQRSNCRRAFNAIRGVLHGCWWQLLAVQSIWETQVVALSRDTLCFSRLPLHIHALHRSGHYSYFFPLNVFKQKRPPFNHSFQLIYSLVEGLSERPRAPFFSLGHSRNQSHRQKGNIHELVTIPGGVDCQDTDQRAQLVYYIAFVVIFQFGWAATQISHLSMIPVMTRFSH